MTFLEGKKSVSDVNIEQGVIILRTQTMQYCKGKPLKTIYRTFALFDPPKKNRSSHDSCRIQPANPFCLCPGPFPSGNWAFGSYRIRSLQSQEGICRIWEEMGDVLTTGFILQPVSSLITRGVEGVTGYL